MRKQMLAFLRDEEGLGAMKAAMTPARLLWPLRIQHARERAQQLRRERSPYALAIAVGAIGAATQRGDLKVAFDYLVGAGG